MGEIYDLQKLVGRICFLHQQQNWRWELFAHPGQGLHSWQLRKFFNGCKLQRCSIWVPQTSRRVFRSWGWWCQTWLKWDEGGMGFSSCFCSVQVARCTDLELSTQTVDYVFDWNIWWKYLFLIGSSFAAVWKQHAVRGLGQTMKMRNRVAVTCPRLGSRTWATHVHPTTDASFVLQPLLCSREQSTDCLKQCCHCGFNLLPYKK